MADAAHSHTRASEDEAAKDQASSARSTESRRRRLATSEQAEALPGVHEVLGDVAVLVVHDPEDETIAEQLVEAIQPHLTVPVYTASEAAEAEIQARDANVVLLLVSKALQDNWRLVEIATKILPHMLVPILIDNEMTDSKMWQGAIAWNFLYFDFCDSTTAKIPNLLDQIIAAYGRTPTPSAHIMGMTEAPPPQEIAVLVVFDPTNNKLAAKMMSLIQPRLCHPVFPVSKAEQAKDETKNAEVALVLVTQALQDNLTLVNAVAEVLPNRLIPIVVEEGVFQSMSRQYDIVWFTPNGIHLNYFKLDGANISVLLSQIIAANEREHEFEFDAYISYEWSIREKAIEIAQELRDRGLEAWLDTQGKDGRLSTSMAEGIDRSKVFLILATERYMGKINRGDRSDNCYREFEYAGSKRFERIVVAALEPDMARPATWWTGRFKLGLARQDPVDLTELSDKAIDRLADAIQTRIDTPEDLSDLTLRLTVLYASLNPCSSGAWAKGKAEKFTLGTRSWIIDEFCDWYNKEQDAVFILVGYSGVGKSVIMTELCHRGGALTTDEDVEKSKADERVEARRKSSRIRSLWRRSKERQPILVAAYHFFRHDDGTAASPAEAILSIAWQLCFTVPYFLEALDEVSFEDLRKKTLADLFKTILVDPLNRLGSDQMRQVVVLDALDECSKSDDVLRNIIRTWKDAMPAWLYLAVSTRPEGEIQRGIINNNLNSKVLELEDSATFRDIEKHIEHLLCDMKDIVDQKDVAICAKILSKCSEGLFLWASFLTETLKRMHEEKRGGLLTLQDIVKRDAIPNGLGGMFYEYFSRLQEKVGGEKRYKMLLAPMVAAREPLSVEKLSAILQLDQYDTDDMIDEASNLLYRGGDRRVALIHKRMADWLSDKQQCGRQLYVKKKDGHKQLADYCSSSRDDVFSLRHAIFHLVKSGKHAEAFELLNDFAWIKKAISVGDDEAERRAIIGNLIRDCVKLGIYFTPESDTPQFLSKTVHALSNNPNELASQVLARLGHNLKVPLALSLQKPDQPWLEPIRVTLAHPRDPLLYVLKGHSDNVTSVAIQGDTIVSGSWDNTVRIWNAMSGEEQLVLKGHSGLVTTVAIQGDTIMSGSNDNTMRIWNATLGEELHVFKGHSDLVNSVAIQGDTIVSGSSDGTVRIWNATSGKQQHVLEGHSEWVRSVAISGDTVVSGSSDNTVRIWNATLGKQQYVLEGHFDSVTNVAIERNTIVSQSDDSTRYWNVQTGQEVTANEADASTLPRSTAMIQVEKGVHVKLSDGVGFTTDHDILSSARLKNVCAIGDKGGMVHILHVQEIEPET